MTLFLLPAAAVSFAVGLPNIFILLLLLLLLLCSSEPAGVRDVIQATLLGSLLFLDRSDLLREWSQAGGPAAHMAAAMQAGTGGGARVCVCVCMCWCVLVVASLLDRCSRCWEAYIGMCMCASTIYVIYVQMHTGHVT
jgi:hypothetical protein